MAKINHANLITAEFAKYRKRAPGNWATTLAEQSGISYEYIIKIANGFRLQNKPA